jgi:hypothetical protein
MENSLQCKDFICQKLYTYILTPTLLLEATEPSGLHLNRAQTSLPLIKSETYGKKDLLLNTILATSEVSTHFVIYIL